MTTKEKVELHNTAISTNERVIIGYCPNCSNVLILTSDGSVWGLMECSCGFLGDTHSVEHKAYYDPMNPARTIFVEGERDAT